MVAATLLSLGEVQLRLWKLRDAQISILRAAAILNAIYELDPIFLGVSLNHQGRAVFKRRKITGFVFFVFLLYAALSAQNGGRVMTALSPIRRVGSPILFPAINLVVT